MEDREALIIDCINKGYSLAETVNFLKERNIPTAKKTVAKVLKNKGFSYDNKLKKWEGTAPNEELIETNVVPNFEVEKRDSFVNVPQETNTIQLLNVLGISPQQLNALISLANERLSGKIGTDPAESIHAVVAKLKNRNRQNKTFYISREIAEDAALFSERKGIKLSALVEIALLEVMEKYK